MAEIDQLSEIIGKLNAEVAENKRQNTALFRKLDAIEEKITKMAGAVEMVADSDWQAMPDAPAMSDAWTLYSQALRDIPATYSSPSDVVWSVEPV